MDIQINYGSKTKLTEEEIEQITTVSNRYGNVQIKKWGSRSGAIDLITTVEIFFLSFVAKPILDGFFKGLFGEAYFKNLGESVREGVAKEIEDFKSYLTSLFQVFISQKLNDEDAIAIVEQIEGVVYYAVLNHNKATEKLIAELPEALVRAIGEVSLKRINVTEPFTVQLYPNFESETWDYLFIPTVDGYGDYINRYYDFSLRQTISISTREEFYNTFNIDERDTYKQIISAKYHEQRQSE